MLLATLHLHISHIKLARLIVTTVSVLLRVPNFYRSHRRSQCKCTLPTLPAQLHGEIIGLGKSAYQRRQTASESDICFTGSMASEIIL